MADASPTVARRTLARVLRQRREGARITAAKAAEHAGMHAATLSKVESATTRIQPGTAQVLMKYYGGTDEECDAVFELAHAARRRGWWQTYKTTPAWFDSYVGLETEADTIRDYQTELIHGLFQTEEYAFALARTAVDVVSDDEAREHAALRKARQERLTGNNPPTLDVIMNESALYREVGGPRVMATQLRHLQECCELPRVTCRILPFNAGEHPAGYGSFMILSFPDSGLKAITYNDVVYIEYGLGALYLEDLADVAHFSGIFDGLRERALSREKSLELIERSLAKYT
ncbi:helix-turn-helix transcriptional regulator [Nocardiopsis sp. EMB25]|uniref:helix-turn-helix domain-containing protein n=1 Tax=Nocardiopsis TaxID=2013 RepID=UPI00034B419A|nr:MULTISPECIES: helix-turn-helix transcriptional regulator [Nocardiopsis]MCY9782458.1 helix-turn-helix transcriptional regulator [Nocardiopsis sp. EMB25]